MKWLSYANRLPVIAIIVFLSSCVQRPFSPVNVGREYGNPTTPWVVSHAVEKNKWALARTKPHNVFQRILCFSYPCRKMIGRRKALHAISFKKFQKEIQKNARRGAYKHLNRQTPDVQKVKPDTILLLPKDTTHITKTKKVIAPIAPILKADSLVTLGEFLFETDSYKLRLEHFSELDLLSKFLRAHPTLEVNVSGHTDNTGSENHNLNLSTLRAEIVSEYLVSKGVPYKKVIYEGFGSSRPVAGNDTPEGRGKNRRVEILIQNPKN